MKKGISSIVLVITIIVVVIFIGTVMLFLFANNPVRQVTVIKSTFNVAQLQSAIMGCLSNLMVTSQEVTVITGSQINQLVSSQQQLLQEHKVVPCVLII